MKRMISYGILLAFGVVAVFGLASPIHADSFIKQVTHTGAIKIMGEDQPAKDDTSMIWLAKDKACMIMPDDHAVIIRSDEGFVYMVDHGKKSYAKMPLSVLTNPEQMMGAKDEEEAQAMAAMMKGMMSVKVTVTPTDEKKKIRNWNAKKYIVETKMPMGSTKSELWASEEVNIDVELFRSVTNAVKSFMPGYSDIMKEMKKIKGIAVLSDDESQMMGVAVKTRTELLECAKKDAPAGIYDVPKGYKEEDTPDMMGR